MTSTEEKPKNLDQPIPGPPHRGPEHWFEVDYDRPMSNLLRVGRFLMSMVSEPVYWVRENIVEANRGPKYYYYHRKYPRALPIDECYLDDLPCQYEADIEYKREQYVDRAILNILQQRRDNCWFWYTTRTESGQLVEDCKEISDTYNREEINFYIKYGDLHLQSSVVHAYNKQKHRMIVERRRAQMEKDGTANEKRPDMI